MKAIDFVSDLYKKIKTFILGKKPDRDFSVLEHIPQLGDCILIESDSLIADGIEWMSCGKVSHAAIYVGGGKRKIIEALSEGVKVKTLDKYFKNDYTITIRRITGLKVNQAEEMKAFAYDQVDKPYDFNQFISLGLYFLANKMGLDDVLRWFGYDVDEHVDDNENAIICSELYVRAAKEAGITLCGRKNLSLITPQDLLKSTKMETIAEV